jgi:MFS family permease
VASDPPLLTRRFVLVTTAALAYFVGLGVLIPVVPLVVEREFDGGGVAVGIAVGAFSLTAALLRPWAGLLGDRSGRRLLMVGGCLVLSVVVACYTLAGGLASLVLLRVFTGVGEAAVFVGAATAVQDLAPPSRRGEAASYFSVAVYGGLALGPAIGEAVLDGPGADTAWLVSAGCCLVAAVLARWTPPFPPGTTGRRAAGPRPSLLHAAGLGPGFVLGLSLIGFAGFTTFVPLYADDVGASSSGAVFSTFAVIVLAVRVVGARIPDRAGPVRVASTALALLSGGLAALALVRSEVGLYGGTALFALGTSLLYPSLMRLVVDATPTSERSSAVATFSIFFDLSQGLGAPLLGVVVALADEPAAFAVGAGLQLASLALLRLKVAARAERAAAALAAAA